MSKTKKKAAPDRATATMTQPVGNDALKVSTTRTVTGAMQKSSKWATATDVQVSVKNWNADADSLETNAKLIADLRVSGGFDQ